MTLFPAWFLSTLIYIALGLCVVGATTLLVLLFIDLKQKRMW